MQKQGAHAITGGQVLMTFLRSSSHILTFVPYFSTGEESSQPIANLLNMQKNMLSIF
jgi:hypothetical protein